MFAMYDDDGLNFRSTIDHLYNLQQVTPSHSVKNDLNNGNFKNQLHQGKITQEAKNTYMQVTNMNVQHEIFHVNQFMSSNVITVEDTATIRECYDLMQEKQIQQLPIIDDKQLYLKGIVTIHDICRYIFSDIQFAENISTEEVSTISTKKIITTDPISDIRRVSKVMLDFNINAIPVVNSNDILVGIVSQNDIVKAVSRIPHMQIWA